MGYRGHDLDLRTPQTWRAMSDDMGASRTPNGPMRKQDQSSEHEIPIWVDDTVLACCNHAYDVALAHRSGEVRVEHLLHALTRIEDAADILDANNIRAASLRRDTATVIASELPVTLTNGSASPRRSDAFEEVLRLAAAHAYQRNQPVSVEDLLYVFLQMRPAIAGIELIDRNLSAERRERAERPMSAFRHRPPAHYAPPPFEPRPYSPRTSRDHAEREHEDHAYGPRFYEPRPRTRRPGRFVEPDVQPRTTSSGLPLPNTVQAATDHLQNSRLDVLEQMVRSVASQIAGQRDDANRFSGGLYDRLQSLEKAMASRPEGEMNFEPLLRRLDEMDESARGTGAIDLEPLLMRLSDIEHKLEKANSVSVDLDTSGVERRLEELERQIGKGLTESVNGLMQKFALVEKNGNLSQVLARLEVIEDSLVGRDGKMSGDLDERIAELAEAVSLQQTTLDDLRASLAADVRDANAAVNEQATLLARTGESLGELVRAVESLRNEERNTVAQVGGLVNTYRSEVEGFLTQSSDSFASHTAELKEVHDALMKLNANQHTLAGSIDQWRSDGAGEISTIATRIEGLEKQAGRPMALLEAMSTNMENMHRLTVERYHRRNRFWYWLFGTDDWVAASWPSQSERIEAERAALRQIRS